MVVASDRALALVSERSYLATVLRDMTTHDLDAVLALNGANVPEVGSVDEARLTHLFAESAIALVHHTDDALDGFCIVFGPGADYDSVNYVWFEANHPGSMYLDRVAVADTARGRGIGSALYAEVERRIAADHPQATGWTLEVNVDPPNEASLAFHRRLGFVEVGRQLSKGIEVSLMRRDL